MTKSIRWRMPVYTRSTAVVRAIATIGLCMLVACSPQEDAKADAARRDYQRQLRACVEQFRKNPMVPIVGGGYLDTRRFDFAVPAVRFENGECGTDGFEASFFWTGEKIVPTGERFTGLPLTQTPKHWQQLNVAARLGNRKFCQQNPDKCKSPLSEAPAEWPEKFTAHLKQYELDVRLPKESVNYVTHDIGLLLRGWPHENGAPRFVVCSIRRDVKKMTREEVESLDFSQERFPCQADFFDFNFKGGAARVSMSTELLPTVTPALRALQQYISDSIIGEQ